MTIEEIAKKYGFPIEELSFSKGVTFYPPFRNKAFKALLKNSLIELKQYSKQKNMKTLDITQQKQSKSKTIRFDERLKVDGTWQRYSPEVSKSMCIKLDYGSDSYDYYLYQSTVGHHTMFRNKK